MLKNIDTPIGMCWDMAHAIDDFQPFLLHFRFRHSSRGGRRYGQAAAAVKLDPFETVSMLTRTKT